MIKSDLNYLFKTIVNSAVIYLPRSCLLPSPKNPESLDPHSRFKEDVKDVKDSVRQEKRGKEEEEEE